MLTITTNPYGYSVKLSAPGLGVRGYSVTAKNVNELHHAIDHYFGGGKRSHCRQPYKTCPLCRKMSP